jgi:hypothetical protein
MPKPTLTQTNWEEQLPALFIKNTVTQDASYDGYMFETYDPDFQHVRNAHRDNPNRIATLVEGDDTSFILLHGYHYVNRIGYFIAKEPLKYFDEIILHDAKDDPE